MNFADEILRRGNVVEFCDEVMVKILKNFGYRNLIVGEKVFLIIIRQNWYSYIDRLTKI